MEKLKRILTILADVAYKNKRVVLALSCLVVFMTTYLLILPAFTLEKDEAIKQGGIDISTEASEDVSDEKSNAVAVDEEAAAVEPSDKKDVSEAKKADKKTKADTAKTKDALSDPLTFEGEGFSVAVEDKAGTLPDKTSIEATELVENPTEGTKAERKAAAEEYRSYYDKALEAVNDEAKGEAEKKISFVKFYDITLQSGDEAIQPEKPVNVTISYDEQQQKDLKVEEKKDVRIIHFAKDEKTGEITAEIIDDKNVDVTLAKSRMTDTTFEAEGFSIYGIVYTVDFHWEVDGKKFDFSIPGGGFASFSQLVEVLGIEKEDTKNFIENVESITFSNPELLSASKVEEDTTVGAIKDALGLDCEYSKELTQEQIAEINAQNVNATDWALISLMPFKSEETLTVTMKNGEKFQVKVTDAQISTHVITSEGEDYIITVTYGEDAQIPDGAELKVREILPDDEEYADYYEEAMHTAINDATNQGLEMPEVSGARVFDIEIYDRNTKIEPSAPVQVRISLVTEEADLLSVVHFAKSGTESMDLTKTTANRDGETAQRETSAAKALSDEDKPVETAESLSEVSFQTDEFSVYTVVTVNNGTNLADGGPYALVSGIAGDPGATTGYSETWGTDYFTIIVNGMAVMDTVSNKHLGVMGVHTWTEESQGVAGGNVTEWGFEKVQNGYRIYAGSGNNKRYIRQDGNSNNIELTQNANQATTFRITPNNDGTVYIQNNSNNHYLANWNDGINLWSHGEWNSSYFRMEYQNNAPSDRRFKFKLCKKSDDYESFAAQKKAVTELVPNDSFLIYRKFVDTSGNESLYALAHDGTFVRVYDGGDCIYWRETDKNLYWNYQEAEDGYVISSHAPGSSTPIYINPVASTSQTLSSTSAKLTLLGRDNGEYGSDIELWDQASYDYAGLHVTVDGTGEATLSAGKRISGTSDEFYFAVSKTMPAAEKETVETVDSEALGIHITMFDYGEDKEYEAGAKVHGMSNEFDGNGTGDNNHNFVEAFHPHQATQLVTPYLQNGVPVSKVYRNNGTNPLTGLFSSGGAITNTVTGVTDLFLKSYYDENGMFRYRSEDNYAYLNTADGNKSFTVYRQAATPYTTDMSVGRSYYYHGHFMPFNDINMDNHLSRLMNQYGNAYENNEIVGELPVGDGRSYEDIYGITGIPNYFTGMKMEAKFSQPRDGKVKSGDDMIFKFTGDDDMWVYIDDVLVLDIGGIHEPLSGTINFATGKVTNPTGSSNTGTKTLYEIFMAARDSCPADVRAKIDAIEWKDVDGDNKPDTFADYTNHSFSAFYMERGAGASNLDIQFNLKTVLTDEFSVTKELPDEIDPRFANEKYKFRAYFRDDSDNDEEKILTPVAKKNNGDEVCVKVVYKDQKDAEGHDIEVPFDADGYFYLRAGEEAVFKMVDESTYYRVEEIIDSATNVGVNINSGTTILSGTADSGFQRVHDRSELHYLNHPKTQDLLITKHIEGDPANWESDNPVFEFRVYMESTITEEVPIPGTDPPETETVTRQKLIPYSQAPYYLVKNEGNELHYYRPDGTNNSMRDCGTTKTICGYTGRSGSINSIPPEYTIVIPELTIGTHFYLEERRDNIPDGYAFVREVLTENTYDTETLYSSSEYEADHHVIDRILARDENDHQAFDPATIGKIKNDVDAESHIYNRKLMGEFSIIKIDETTGNSETPKKLPDAVFTLRKISAESPFGYEWTEAQAIERPTDRNGIAAFTDLSNGYYEVKETQPPAGYVNTSEDSFFVHVNGTTVTMVAKPASGNEWQIINTAADGKFTYAAAITDNPETEEVDETTTATVTVKNTPGAALPHTGGSGTSLIYIIGFMLTGLAGAGLVMKRRKRNAA